MSHAALRVSEAMAGDDHGRKGLAMMSVRERFLRTMRYEPVDRPLRPPPGNPWPATRERWEREGLPKGVNLAEYFGMDDLKIRHVGIETLFWPPFAVEVLEETDEFVIRINERGVKVREFKDGSSMPEFLEYPIKGPESLGWLRERLAWRAERVLPDWLAQARRWREEDCVLLCNGGMYFAFLNEHLGTDHLMLMYFDHPEFIHEINDRLCALCERALELALAEIELDFIGYHEDMAYKNGSLISPAMFREFMTPYYRRISQVADRFGVDLRYMDSDGDIRELIPLWLECGIGLMSPLEVAAGMDVVALRREYGRKLTMVGGFDKRILAADRAAITREFARLRPVLEEGGYQLSCDHGVPPDVPLANYAHLCELLRTLEC